MNKWWMSAAAVAMMGLAGCSSQNSDLSQWIEEVKQKPGRELPAMPPAPEYDRFAYQAHDLRDPFRAFVPDPNALQQGPRPDPQRPREPLEEYPLDSLRMVGHIGEGVNRQALVMDPTGITHRISPGRYLGTSDGRVVGVSPTRIDIVELTANGQGGWEEVSSAISLARP